MLLAGALVATAAGPALQPAISSLGARSLKAARAAAATARAGTGSLAAAAAWPMLLAPTVQHLAFQAFLSKLPGVVSNDSAG